MINLEHFALASFMLIGLVNGIQLAVDKDWASFARFMTAVLAGGLFGFLGWFNLPSLEIGLAVGISSSGVYKLAQKIGEEH
jgi:hydrogenase/urease accessory protein HupE